MADNDQRETSMGAHQVGTNASPRNGALDLTHTWQSALQQLYKQQSAGPQSTFLAAGVMAVQHPYAQLWASQPALMYGAQLFGGVNPYGFLPDVAQNQAAAAEAIGIAGTIAPAGVGLPNGSAAQQSGAPAITHKLASRLPSGGSQGFQPVQQPQAESQAEPRRKRRKQETPRGGVEKAPGEEAEPSSRSRSGTPTPSSGDMSQQRGMSAGLEAMSGELSNGGKGNQGVSGVSGASDWRRQRATVSSGGEGEPGSMPGIQDEREVKKLRRKQSNRESARRSRLRKQAECEALSGKVKDLQRENSKLKTNNKALEDRVEALVRLLEQRPANGPANDVSCAPEEEKLCARKVQSEELSLASKPSTQGILSSVVSPSNDAPPKETILVAA